MEELRGAEEKWWLIMRELDVRVDDITSPDSTDCLREVVRRWLHLGVYTSQNFTSWTTIIRLLRVVEESTLADNLKAKYIPGELTTTTSSQYSLESHHEECILLYYD